MPLTCNRETPSLLRQTLPPYSSPSFLCVGAIFLSLLLVGLLEPGMALAQDVAAEANPAAQPSLLEGLFKLLPLFGIVFMIFYLMVLRPQEKQEREHQELMDSLKTGVWLLTSGGLIGKLVAIEEETVVLEISTGVKAKFQKSSIVKQVDSAVASSKGGSATKKKKTA